MTRRATRILGITALTLSIVFFGLGMYFPLLSTYTQVIFKFGYEEVTVFRSIAMFFESGEYLLAGVILVFAVILPIAKYIELFFDMILNKKIGRIKHELDRWNMLDVFLVALLLLNFKMNSNIVVMELGIGTTFIALAVIFRIVTLTLSANLKTEKI